MGKQIQTYLERRAPHDAAAPPTIDNTHLERPLAAHVAHLNVQPRVRESQVEVDIWRAADVCGAQSGRLDVCDGGRECVACVSVPGFGDGTEWGWLDEGGCVFGLGVGGRVVEDADEGICGEGGVCVL
jgi:hypothetical protein